MKIDKEAFGAFFDGTPGKSWDDYASRLKNAAAGEVDERGYSLADEFDGVAEGQPGGPAFPGAAAQLPARGVVVRRVGPEHGAQLVGERDVDERVEGLATALRRDVLHQATGEAPIHRAEGLADPEVRDGDGISES